MTKPKPRLKAREWEIAVTKDGHIAFGLSPSDFDRSYASWVRVREIMPSKPKKKGAKK